MIDDILTFLSGPLVVPVIALIASTILWRRFIQAIFNVTRSFTETTPAKARTDPATQKLSPVNPDAVPTMRELAGVLPQVTYQVQTAIYFRCTHCGITLPYLPGTQGVCPGCKSNYTIPGVEA